MIFLEDILELHNKSIIDFGGSHGVRDLGLVEAAIAQPFQAFGGEELHKNIFEKAAALGESLIINYPFVDGNKRTGMLAMVSLLVSTGYRFTATPDNLYNFIIDIATGNISFDRIVEWLKENTVENIKEI
ncbi:type II toxin-antitoxin system death-on-curing family toxin [Segetibacter sp.]|jgi:death-on-curing protein|uniref:type II toxin-antitoxin system death-on-curing family toxin n=1 Tax=Segetibacter sp. TaxID=2231182 RepID=UPI0026363C36|nr:type II toxin-antitoxin system death-on-curing family toxin [Segetibacter sp.]MCW3081281.1 death-on-curing family protein [Segetibacter sp.]